MATKAIRLCHIKILYSPRLTHPELKQGLLFSSLPIVEVDLDPKLLPPATDDVKGSSKCARYGHYISSRCSTGILEALHCRAV
jgi:hypothetical protein